MTTAAMPDSAFPKLTPQELDLLRPLAVPCRYADGQVIFKAGQADIDFFVVEAGAMEILNPTDHDRRVTIHEPGEFAGDIDLLTRRPVIVTAVARGATVLLRVPGEQFRRLLTTIPRVSDKILVALQVRRKLLSQAGVLGMRVVGPGHCRDTNVVREFLQRNFVPFTWYDTDEPGGRAEFEAMGRPAKTPAVDCGDGRVMLNPSLRELARCAGIWRDCPTEVQDLAIVGAGPAGITAAVYAASEGLATTVLDRLGPGGQAAGSSKIENFIGFPAGLPGSELATRGVLQMLKFGAQLSTPMAVERLEVGEEGRPHALHLDCGAVLRAHVVLIATGVKWRRLEVPGIQRFESAGVHYSCTSIEALLYEGRDVAVVGGGNSAGQAAMFLAERCAGTVHMLVRRDAFGPGMSEYLASRIRATKNIRVHTGTEITAVHGEQEIRSITVRENADGRQSPLDVTAVFVFIGAEPGARWLPPAVARDELGYILTGPEAGRSKEWPLRDRPPCALETTIPRVLAAGDIRSGSTKRVGFAVGDGSLAVTCTHRLRTAGA